MRDKKKVWDSHIDRDRARGKKNRKGDEKKVAKERGDDGKGQRQ